MQNYVKIDYFMSAGPGGQRRDKKKTGVRVRHLSTGLIVRVDNQRSQSQNKKTALLMLAKKLKKLHQRKKRRIPTKVPRYAKEARLKSKKHLAQKKNLRRTIDY